MSELERIPSYNTRIDMMWEFIKDNVDFTDKSVLDAGCGYGDMLWRAYKAGARIVFGFDNNRHVIWSVGERLDSYGYKGHPIHIHNVDISNWNERWPGWHDIIICFSVLPYLRDPIHILEGMKRDSDIVLLECQYEGDGPGFEGLKDDTDMTRLLCGDAKGMKKPLRDWDGFEIIEKIGETPIIGRDKSRSVWICR